MDVERQKLKKMRFWVVRRNHFARNGRRTSKTEEKLRFFLKLEPFRTKWTSNVKNWSKIAILSSPAQPFRTKWTSNIKNWKIFAIFKFCGDPFARNGRRTSKTEEKLRSLFQIWTLSHEMDVERQKLQ